MRFQTPQFIEVEDKIFGPLTLKQFIYLAGGGGLSFILYRALPLYIAIFLIAPIVALSLALAFYKVNNRSFIYILEAAVRFLTRDKLYLWQKRERPPEERRKEATPASDFFVPRLSESKLKDIAWSLDVHESIYAGQKKPPVGERASQP